MLDIISCSRRTDIPAFYYDWLQKSLENKYIMVNNPYNGKSYMVDLFAEKVHSICLWSKSFNNVIKNPGLLSLYNLYFNFTITDFPKLLEPNVIDTIEAIRQMEILATRYSPEQINWRFDPIILYSPSLSGYEELKRERLNKFNALCRDISSTGIDRCTISFLQMYSKVQRRFEVNNIKCFTPTIEQQIQIVSEMAEIANKYRMKLYTCASPLIEGVPGVFKGHCIDGTYLEGLFGKRASRAKDTGQREGCGCTKSKDIGSYRGQICQHGCRYCYAMY